MKQTILFLVLLCGTLCSSANHSIAPAPLAFDKEAFYKVLSGTSADAIDQQIEVVNKAGIAEKDAYTGALLMKKAGIVKGAGKKLNIFKEGKGKLESAISKDPNNAEYRFLRLLIQEHAPGIVNYDSNIDKDKEVVKKSYKSLPKEVQTAIVNYSKTSKALKSSDLN